MSNERRGEKSGRALYEMRYTHVDKMRPHLYVPGYNATGTAAKLRTAPEN